MKTNFFKILLASIFVIISGINYSCNRENKYDDSEVVDIKESGTPATENDHLDFLNGTVVITFSPDEVKNPSELNVSEYLHDECMDMSDCNWIVNMIYITPQLTFNAPVYVTINYDKAKINSSLSLEEENPVLYYWPDEENFAKLTRRETVSYDFDENLNTINFYIKKTGLYALGLMVP